MSGLLRTRLLNFVLFQAGWFCCVLGAASGRPWLGAGLGLLLVLGHLGLVRARRKEAALLLGALAVGLVTDTLHLRTGSLVFTGGSLHPDFAPAWILVMWMQFASTLRFAMSWLEGRYVLGGLLGGVAGAMAYWAGVRLGAATLGPDAAVSLVRIGLSWALALPLLLFLAGGDGEDGARLYRIF